jgi:hypothetical protein
LHGFVHFGVVELGSEGAFLRRERFVAERSPSQELGRLVHPADLTMRICYRDGVCSVLFIVFFPKGFCP